MRGAGATALGFSPPGGRSDARQFNARAAVLRRQFDAYEPFPGIHVKGDLTTAGDPLALKMLMARSSSIARRLND
jgi:hypothetical protein